MKNSIEKINVISNDLTKLREELVTLKEVLKETLLINNHLLDEAMLNDLLNHIDTFKEINIPELISNLSVEIF